MSNENLESKRWLIAGAAIVMQLCLGTVYAWSVFKIPLMKAHGWSDFEVSSTMMILMAVIGVSAAFGGTLVDKKGPRFVATIGGILFGSGVLLAGFADQVGNLFLLYLGFGIIGGLGNGFGYVTPIATLIRWFPDKRGLITGLAVMGFGAGAFFMGKIAPGMVNDMGVAQTFYIWGVIFRPTNFDPSKKYPPMMTARTKAEASTSRASQLARVLALSSAVAVANVSPLICS